MGNAKDSEVNGRPKWDNKTQYLLTCIGFAVGVGNLWRFPYFCQIYGGGAFLIPYFIALVFEGLPLLYLEMALGQRLRMGSVGVWYSISPFLGGVGIASMIVSLLVSLFYNTLLAWIIWYFFNSFQNPLPWSQCPLNNDKTGYDAECANSTSVNYFWYRYTLNITPDIETSGSLQWWMVICVASAWLVIYICFIKGLKSMGKAVYVTATFPYLVLTIFLIRAITLPGATDGLVYLFTPDWEKLKLPQVWLDAATQIFFSLSVAFGGIIAFSSYTAEKNNCERDAIVVGLVNSATSLYGSIPIFSILGFKANTALNNCLQKNILELTNSFNIADQNITVDNYHQWLEHLNSTSPDAVARLSLEKCDLHEFLQDSVSGTGLAFIVFTQAVMEMPGSQVWAVLFFIMLFSLGLSSMFGNMEGVLTPISDLKVIPKWIPYEVQTGVVCFLCFLVGLIFALGSGNYWLEVFNSYVGSIPLLIVAFFEIIGVIYIHGIKTFSEDIYYMTGKKPSIYWKACWMVFSPLMLFVVLVFYVVVQAQKHPTYPAWNPHYDKFPKTEVKPYPDWVFAIIILLCVVPVLSIPLVAVIQCVKRKGSSCHDRKPYCNEAYEAETEDQMKRST
ncbi:sodium-dependent neutral amino acid transporter B(0)AT3-like [Thalassophryne amazonica]|uniref:sodium-dependent neutral amino acid transporter B(0)AT3-like n=1 Tax=Thalassophryne amazonica TaxID=390379 RepID=UPI0014713557|nr:sodium-dependent neutral amino acid transporter B(0)AT3-like [Thalassophryne amazonica]